MKNKIFAGICALAMAVSMVGCGGGDEETTLTGMVTKVEGTVITLMEMDSSQQGDKQRRSGFGNFEGFDPEQFGGTMPEGMDPENFTRPEGMEDFDPENFKTPEGMEGFDPEQFGGTMPEGFEGGRPSRGDGSGEAPSFQMPEGAGETVTLDLANAHISLEKDGVKESGSVSDIKEGSFVTVTKNGQGQVTNVLVTSSSGFGGMGGFRGGKGSSDAES